MGDHRASIKIEMEFHGIKDKTDCPQDNHALFVWTIDKFLHQTEQMFKDYRLHARIIWDKTNGVVPAFSKCDSNI